MIRCLSTVLGRVRDLPVSLLWRALATATAERDDALVQVERQAMFRRAADERALRSERLLVEVRGELAKVRADLCLWLDERMEREQ